jgi:hypothetical protein
MPWLKQATALEDVGTLDNWFELAGPRAGEAGEVVEFTGPVEISFGFCGRPSSFRHINTPRLWFLSLKSPIEGWKLVATQKEQHITALMPCK